MFKWEKRFSFWIPGKLMHLEFTHHFYKVEKVCINFDFQLSKHVTWVASADKYLKGSSEFITVI